MIAIVNIGPHTRDTGGLRSYEVRINGRVIATFKHYRCDGLATCLRLAALAVQQAQAMELAQLAPCFVTPEETVFLSNSGIIPGSMEVKSHAD